MTLSSSDKHQLNLDEKYSLYEASVQCPEYDVEFFIDEYKKKYQVAPHTLREDFCGTGAISCEWVKKDNKNMAYGIDLDQEPIEYGLKKHFSRLSAAEQKRMHYIQKNVLQAHEYKADVIVALNFSYFIFKTRQQLLDYFISVKKSLNSKGMFFLDIFGGIECQSPIVDETEHDDFTYYWDCDKFNPLTHECLYKIHFKKHKEKIKYEDVFVYEWRQWTVPEVRDILIDAGFSSTSAYWEDEDEDGEGDGNFYVTEDSENCDSWISYITAVN